jgi:hypothetical protein
MSRNSVTSINENTTNYTELRANANELLNYVSYAAEKDLAEIRSTISKLQAQSPINQETTNINELMLSSNEPILLYEALRVLIKDKDKAFTHSSISAFPTSDNTLLNTKKISLFYHDASIATSYTSVLSDISALFCSMIPSTEMSLCVPYFDVRIIYPKDNLELPALNLLKFVGASPRSRINDSSDIRSSIPLSSDTGTKYGFDVVGMEIFGVPQTVAPTSDSFKTTAAYQERGVDVLDPITPLMTIEGASIQQIGVGGGLNTQSKISLDLTLHDRSRLGDIEPLVSSGIFPLVTFRVTYGWLHPDTNKMSNNVYARLLNSMRVVQDYAVSSVSFSTKGPTALKMTISLAGTGTHLSKAAKIISASGEYVPYSAVNNLVKQFIVLKSKRSKDKTLEEQQSQLANFAQVGTTVISSVTAAASSKKFVPIKDFYNLYERLNTKVRNNADMADVVNILNNMVVLDQPPTIKFTELFKFYQTNFNKYGDIDGSIIMSNSFVLDELSQFVYDTAIGAGYMPRPENNTTNFVTISDPENPYSMSTRIETTEVLGEALVVPLAEMISSLVAKPLLASQPDIKEVRIHCFSFNSACGRMAEENIGNFPIVKSKFLEYHEENENDRKINLNTSPDGALNLLVKYINDPTSPFFGFSSNYESAIEGAKVLKEMMTGAASEELQRQLDDLYQRTQNTIDELNATYLKNKKITLTDTSFIPPRVKIQLDVLPACDNPNDKSKPQDRIARIVVYDERCGSFNKLGNLIFSMINSNGIASLDPDSGGLNVEGISLASKVDSLKKTLADDAHRKSMYVIKDKKIVRNIASNLYPTLVIGSEGSLISNASYSTSPSGDLQSSFLLTALQEQSSGGSSIGASSDSPLVDDVFVNPSNINLTMMGNTCIARGQTYYVDFNTGTTLDNSYTVTSVSHNIKPGSFTTSAILRPTNSASLKSVQKQMQELVVKIQDTYNVQLPLTRKSITELSRMIGTATRK